jgi:hypothetical protein
VVDMVKWIAFKKDHEHETTISDTLKNLLAGHVIFVMCLGCYGVGCEACSFCGEVEKKPFDMEDI